MNLSLPAFTNIHIELNCLYPLTDVLYCGIEHVLIVL